MVMEVTLSAHETKRLGVIEETLAGRVTVRTATGILVLSERQVYRLRQRVRGAGAAGVVHGNRGRPPVHTRPAGGRERVVELYRKDYIEFGRLARTILSTRVGAGAMRIQCRLPSSQGRGG